MKQLSAFLLCCFAVAAQPAKEWQSTFPVDKANLGIEGANPWFPLTPGYRLEYRHGRRTETVTVLDETREIDGVRTRVVEDRELESGQLSELTRDYYAVDRTTGDLYYFGEDVDVYKNGKVVSHEGGWISGRNGASFGLFLPGKPRPGQRFYQERAPGIGMDRAEIVSDAEKLSVPAGTFEKCVHLVETSALEKGVRDHKWYAPGVGPVKDADMLLVSYGKK